jgi:hypothetical protein
MITAFTAVVQSAAPTVTAASASLPPPSPNGARSAPESSRRGLTPVTRSSQRLSRPPPSVQHDPIFGVPEIFEEGWHRHIKGNLVRARSRYVREVWGETALSALAEGLPPPARRYLIEPPLASSWVEAGPMYLVDRAIVEGPMKGDVSRMRAFGQDIARYDLPTVYRVFLKMVSAPAFLMRRANLIYSLYYKNGTMRSLAKEGRAEVELSGAAVPLYMCSQGISGWLEASIETCGATPRPVEHARCRHRGDPTCKWVVTWSEERR